MGIGQGHKKRQPQQKVARIALLIPVESWEEADKVGFFLAAEGISAAGVELHDHEWEQLWSGMMEARKIAQKVKKPVKVLVKEAKNSEMSH